MKQYGGMGDKVIEATLDSLLGGILDHTLVCKQSG